MNPSRTLLLLLGALALTACGGGGGGGDVLPDDSVPRVALTASFVHTARVGDTVGYLTYLDHPIANGNPGAYVLVTPAYVPDPHGGLGTYVNHNVGVRYAASEGRWAVTYLDRDAMLVGATFNVTVSSGWNADPTAFFVHRTSAASIDFTRSFLDHPAANGNPSAILLLTPNSTPEGTLARNHDHPVGVVYDAASARWAVYNRDSERMDDDVAFNVAVVGLRGAGPFDQMGWHRSTDGNRALGSTWLSDASNPAAIVQATVVFNPGGADTGVAYGNHFGVWFDEGWAIFNQNATIMRAGPCWNVAVTVP